MATDSTDRTGSTPLDPTVVLPPSTSDVFGHAGGSNGSPARPTHIEVESPTNPQDQTVVTPPPAKAPAIPAGAAIPGYEILSVLGRGGMGVVYQAKQLSLNRVVALKVMVAGVHASEADLARFRTEAMTVAQLQHPNIIQIYDIGEHAGVPFLAVEYVGGGNLGKWLGGQPMSVPVAVRLVSTIARAVGAAHKKGIVHRDLKPANILLTTDNTPKVADFGLAKQAGDTTLTATGAILGTPNYMAPEQAAGLTRRVGPQADVYALGVILYECLTGKPPFAGSSLIEMLDKVRFAPPPAVRDLRADVPPEVEAVVRRCLNKVPEERYPNADVLADALNHVVAGWEAKIREAAAPPKEGGFGWLVTLLGVVAAVGVAVLIARDVWFSDKKTDAKSEKKQADDTPPIKAPIGTP